MVDAIVLFLRKSFCCFPQAEIGMRAIVLAIVAIQVGLAHPACAENAGDGEVAAYCPDAGDIIWLDFQQAVANEQSGRRPALVLSPLAFNELTGRCIACPITRRDRDWSFHVPIPDGNEIGGVVQADQLRSASWAQRGSRFICKAPASVLDEVRARLRPLLSL